MVFSACMWAVANTLWRPFRSLYTLELGITEERLGSLSMIETLFLLLFQLPERLLADKFGRRKVTVYFTALRVLLQSSIF